MPTTMTARLSGQLKSPALLLAAVGAAATDPDDKQMEADEDFARQLQAKMDAEMRAK